MKIKRLDLKAFGPFTDQTIEFKSGDPGLHIVFGSNEAGKSSSLRALTALLHGFPSRTADNFLHPNNKLLVGGCLESEDGRELAFLRRKKRKADLLDENGEVMDSGLLVSFLQGLTPTLFHSLYGIDYHGLVRGGEDILEQRGEVGEAIFSAGTGLSTLRDTISMLDDEAEKLFKPQGSTPQINTLIREYNELQKEIKALSLNSRDWEEHKRVLDDAAGRLREVERKRNVRDREKRRLERLLQIKPQMALRDRVKQEMNDLGPVVLLADDFSEIRQKAQKNLHAAEKQHEGALHRLDALRQKFAQIAVNRTVLDQAELIEGLLQRLGEFKKGVQDKPKLDGMRINLRGEASSLLKQVLPQYSLDNVELLRPVLGKSKLIINLIKEHDSLSQKLADSHEQQEEATRQLKSIRLQLSDFLQPSSSENLQLAVTLARKMGDVDLLLSRKKSSLATGRENGRKELSLLGLWSGDFDQIQDLSPPMQETVERFEKDFYAVNEKLRLTLNDIEESRRILQETDEKISRMKQGGALPTEDELSRERERRDFFWQLLKRKWLAGEDISSEAERTGEGDLPVAFEKSIASADQLVDLLRSEAGRVLQFAELTLVRDLQEKRLGALLVKEKDALESFDMLQEMWRAQWVSCRITPLPPKEMFAWLARFNKIRLMAAEMSSLEGEIRQIEEEQQQKRTILSEELAKLGVTCSFPGNDLEPVLVQAENILEQNRQAVKKLDSLQEQEKLAALNLQGFKEKVEQGRNLFSGWQRRWKDLFDTLSLSLITPDEAGDLLDALRGCFDKLREAGVLEKRIAGIDLDQQGFSKDVSEAVRLFCPREKDVSTERLVLKLQALLKEARKNEILQKQFAKQIENEQAEADSSINSMAAAQDELARLCLKAQCVAPEELEKAERLSERNRSLCEKLASIEEAVIQMAEGMPLDELESQVREANPDELPSRISSLAHEIEDEFEPEIKNLSEIIGKEKTELKRMDGSGAAAEKKEAAEQKLARITRLSGKYARVKVAARVLADEIERYREKNQDPVLQRASQFFNKLTLDSFSGLRTDEDDKRRPILVGTREGDQRVEVGQMSSGTRDQLFLSLRLASLEWRHRTTEPMPFIVDDILINFDDARTEVTLQILADLAHECQVILFTHHRQVVQSAGNIRAKGSVHIHNL